MNYIDEFKTHPKFQTWSLDLQKEFGNNIVATVGYLGSKGSDLAIGGVERTPPLPGTSWIRQSRPSRVTRSTISCRTRSKVLVTATTTR